jgi:hypothetical protein
MALNRYFSRILVPAVTAFALLAAAQPGTTPSPLGKPQPTLPTITLKVGNQNVRAEIANTEPTRQTGMMFRTKMGKNEGMLFVFEAPSYHAMWMRNTLIPLSVAYMDANGVIVSIHEMEPLTENPHQAAGPVIYALEMNKKWFKNNKVKTGDRIIGLEKASKAK